MALGVVKGERTKQATGTDIQANDTETFSAYERKWVLSFTPEELKNLFRTVIDVEPALLRAGMVAVGTTLISGADNGADGADEDGGLNASDLLLCSTATRTVLDRMLKVGKEGSARSQPLKVSHYIYRGNGRRRLKCSVDTPKIP